MYHSPLQDGRYLLLETEGRGGSAAVHCAFDRLEQRRVALKVLSEHRRAGPAHPLSSEYELWSRLRHRNVVRAYELAVARHGPLPRRRPYLVMEHVDGGPVHHTHDRPSPTRLETLAVQLLRALRHIHESGLVHRDLKPANVLLGNGGEDALKVTDFGLATRIGNADPPGVIHGSLPYLAPESFVGGVVDGRADLYGMGILLYRLATGELPGPSGRVEDLLRWHLGGPLADPRRRRPRFPDRLARFIRRLTERRPEARPASADEALELLGRGSPRPSRSAPRVIDRAELARVRLALDATRLGARRRLVLPALHPSREALLREARVRCQVLGLGYQQLEPARHGRSSLGATVLRLLVDREPGAAALVRRYRLDRTFPLSLISGLPSWDRSRAAERASVSLTGVIEFLLDCSSRRPLVLAFDQAAVRDSLTQRSLCALRRETEPPRPPDPGRGGLLLLETGSCCPGDSG